MVSSLPMIENLIYDVGMNNGDDTAYYLHRGFRVVAIEADPVLAGQASRRFEREIAAGRLVIVNVGIAAESGVFPFWICEDHPEWSSFHREVASRDGCRHHAIDIPCRPFASLLEEHGVPYYLKVDIEGNDYLCVQGLKQDDLPKYVSVESQDLGLLQHFRDLGYTGFKCVSQFTFLPIEIPPSREQRRHERIRQLLSSRHPFLRMARPFGVGRLLNRELGRTRKCKGWTFPHGSSGPFGEDTPGRWKSLEEMWNACQHLKRLQSEGKPSVFWINADYSFWTDFHVRRDG